MGEVAQFTGGKVPQKLADAIAGDNDDLSSGVRGGYSVVSIRGSRWHIKVGDEETTVSNVGFGVCGRDSAGLGPEPQRRDGCRCEQHRSGAERGGELSRYGDPQ